jgi:hypothetical protein
MMPSHQHQADPSAVAIHLSPDTFKPLIEDVVREALSRLEEARAAVPDGRLAYSEEEAARLLGLEPHVLRDERRRGRITASQIVGRRVRYMRQDLLDYLMGRRVNADEGR